MRFGVLGTGTVGNAIASKLVSLGHDVRMGSRTAGGEKAKAWVASTNGHGSEGTFADAAAFGALLFNCTSGGGSLEALRAAGEANLDGKVLVDIANPLDFSKGMPPSLFISNTDSLAETLQRAFPNLKVVKTLNTVNASIMVNPGKLANGEHELFICSNDAEAKERVRELLTSFGWKHFIDLGDLTGARGMEMYLPLWVRMWGSLQLSEFNVRVVR